MKSSNVLILLVVILVVGCAKEPVSQETRMYQCQVSPSQITATTGHVCAAGTPTSDEAAALVLVQSETASDEYTPVIHNHLGRTKFFLVKNGNYDQMTVRSNNWIDVESDKTTRDTLPIVKSGDRLLWIACPYKDGGYDAGNCLEPVEVTVGVTSGDYPEGHEKLIASVIPRRRACVSVPELMICYDSFEQAWHLLSENTGVLKLEYIDLPFSAGDDLTKSDAGAFPGKQFDFKVWFGNDVNDQVRQKRIPNIELNCTLGEKMFSCDSGDLWAKATIELESFNGISGEIETQFHPEGTAIQSRSDASMLWLENNSSDSLTVQMFAMEISGSTSFYKTAYKITEANLSGNSQSNTPFKAAIEQNSVYCLRIVNHQNWKYEDQFFQVDYATRGFKTALSNQVNGQCQ